MRKMHARIIISIFAIAIALWIMFAIAAALMPIAILVIAIAAVLWIAMNAKRWKAYAKNN